MWVKSDLGDLTFDTPCDYTHPVCVRVADGMEVCALGRHFSEKIHTYLLICLVQAPPQPPSSQHCQKSSYTAAATSHLMQG